MFAEKQKTFWLLHIMDIHSPYLNSRISDDNYNTENEQYKLARMEVDEQLAFYEPFLNKDTTRIYMSDYGQRELKKFHVLFNIYQRKRKPRKINGLISLSDFNKILRQIVVGGNINEAEFIREYVEIGRLDRYNYELVSKIFKERQTLLSDFFGFKGIVDKEYIFASGQDGNGCRKEMIYL